MSESFRDRLKAVQAARATKLCVGLDPDPDRLPRHLKSRSSPAEAVLAFNKAVIYATSEHACAYKFNLAFYEAFGPEAWRVLTTTLSYIPKGILTIADGKRGDIGNSARFYAETLFKLLGFDACTVAPYMGKDAVMPFLAYPGRGAFVLARTSNPGARDFQELQVQSEMLYERVARNVAAWEDESPGSAGLVVGATDVSAIAQLRACCPELPFLVPGVGAQGGDTTSAVRFGKGRRGIVLINSSRQIIYASGGRDFAEAAEAAASTLRREIAMA